MSKQKIKVGDKVKILVGQCGYKAGDEGIVVKISNIANSCHVFVEGRNSTSVLSPNVAYDEDYLELIEEKPVKTFPRMMMVGDDKNDLKPRIVIAKDLREYADYPFIAADSDDDYNNGECYSVDCWKFAEDLHKKIKITRAQIKEWAGGEFEIID